MKRGITIILAAVMALGLGLGGLSVAKNAQGTKEFISDGYILDPSDEEYVTDNVDTQYYFSAGAKYKEKYGSQIVFKSSTGDNQTIDSQHFIHYNDGSLGAFTKGVLMDVSEINDSNYGYYSLTQNTVLIKNGNSYEMTSRGEAMNITEFIWKISDTDYMLVSPNIALNIGGNDVNFSDYVQLTYVDNGIVRLTHQSGTYQTVAADSKLVTQNGIELNLVGKEFIVDGEPVFSLDDMAIDDDSYIDVDENITDQPTIPTFNVINGKDGANGTDGIDGEQGIEGEEGQEGEQGSEGDEGAEGSSGTAGGSGGDGVEGDTGIMGYDGAEGLDGKDAETAASASTIASVDLLTRPTITVDAGDTSSGSVAYNVTAQTASMTVNLDDSDNSLHSGSTKVKLYNKKTMELVDQTKTESQQLNLGQDLEAGQAVFNFVKLDADTEYVLVVEGEYEIDKDGNYQSGVLFQKVFKTEPFGIAIAKDHVTDTEIAAITRVTGSVTSYSVEFFYYDENQQEVSVCRFDNSTGNGATYIVNDTNPAPGDNERQPNSDIKSNTTYYARLLSPTSNGQLLAIKDSEVELKTLKMAPCDSKEYNKNPKAYKYVPEMQPTLTPNNKNHSYTVEMNSLVDLDQGISGYRVELYKAQDIGNVPLENLTPTYTKEITEYSATTISIPDTDPASYRARIVVLFNDNEKDVELSTLFSNSASLSSSGGKLTVEFIGYTDSTKNVDIAADEIEGYIKISDNDMISTQVLQYINGTYPLVLEVSGEYADVYTIRFDNPNDLNVITKNADHWLFHYKLSGLHQKSTYTMRVVGPQNTDNSTDGIKGAEATTYLAGLRINTETYESVVLMSKRRTSGSAAFNYGLYVAPTIPSTSTAPGDDKKIANAKQAVANMETLELTLTHFDGVRERVLGQPAKLVDSQDSLIHTSDFQTSLHNYEDGEENPDSTLGDPGKRGLLLKDATSIDDTTLFNVTPASFGIDDQDSSLYAGGIYKIKVTAAKDYTGTEGFVNGAGGNDIPFKDGQDLIVFAIQKTHVRSTTPNDQVEVTLLTNANARSGCEEAGVSEDTVVGIRFGAEYGYADVKKIEYNIYEVTSDIVDYSPKVGSTPAVDGTFISAEGKVLTKVDEDNYTLEGTQKCSLVLTGTHTRSGNEYTVSDVELYFKNTNDPDTYCDWKDENGVSAANRTILKRGKRYIVSYRVYADYEITNHGTGDHWYPNCVYSNTATMPLYRSAVINLERQMPVVERYPISSTNTEETWNYRIIDPDEAIIVDGSKDATLYTKSADAYTDFNDTTTASILSILDTAAMTGFNSQTNKLRVPDHENFAPYTISSLTAGKYYRIAVPYKLLDSADVKYLTSKPMKHTAVNSITDANIYMHGVKITSNDYADDQLGTTGNVKPILNEGNYRYKLTIMGADIDKFAAFRVEVTGTSETVVYDPVYVSYRGSYQETPPSGPYVPYGLLYIDQAPLSNFAGQNVTFKVTGYYSTGSSGFGEFVSSPSRGEFTSVFDNAKFANNTFYIGSAASDQESVYAFKNINGADGSYNYRTRQNQGWGLTQNMGVSVLGSLFVPGTSVGSGLNITQPSLGSATATFGARFFTDPLVMSAQPETVNEGGLSFDETGIHVGNNYYTVEKLAYKDGINIEYIPNPAQSSVSDYTKSGYTITQNAVTAAIKRDSITPGATTAALDMSLMGVNTSQIYAKVFKKTSGTDTPMYLAKKTENGGAVTFYEVYDAVNASEGAYDYDTPEFKSNTAIAVDSNNKVSLKLRKLTKQTEYGVLFFVYGADGHEVPLYSIDFGRTNVQYTFQTANEIQINITEPAYIYSMYDSKTAAIGYAIPGDEGTGIKLFYKLVAGNNADTGTVLVDNTEITPKGTGTYRYYNQRADLNNPVYLSFNPVGGTLQLAGTYTLRITGYVFQYNGTGTDGTIGELLGSKDKTFTVPSTLTSPSFFVQLKSNGTNLIADVSATDVNKSLFRTYDVKLYDVSMMNNTEDPLTSTSGLIDTQTITPNFTVLGDLAKDPVTFTNIPAGNYLVRVIGKADLNNNNSFNPAEGDIYVTYETMSNAVTSATATVGASGDVNAFTIEFRNLSNFDNVTSALITVNDSDGSIVYTSGTAIPIDHDDIVAGQFTLDIDWHNSPVTANKSYNLTIQLRDESVTPYNRLGQIETIITPIAATP